MYLIFVMQGNRYAFDLDRIAAVSDTLRCWPIPAAPQCYKGAVNIHGTIITVIDLALFMDLPECRVPEKMVVLAPEISSLAFLVESVIRVAPENEVIRIDPPQSRFATSTLILSDGNVILLDVDAMVIAAEKLIA
jgi:purine-binding chemotaxis protein CheW